MTVAEDISASLVPGVRAELEAHKSEIIAATGLGPILRKAFAMLWPIFLRMLPWLLMAATKASLDKYATMTLSEVGETLSAHRVQSSGRGAGLPPPYLAPE